MVYSLIVFDRDGIDHEAEYWMGRIQTMVRLLRKYRQDHKLSKDTELVIQNDTYIPHDVMRLINIFEKCRLERP
jgi:hypothetical protein